MYNNAGQAPQIYAPTAGTGQAPLPQENYVAPNFYNNTGLHSDEDMEEE